MIYSNSRLSQQQQHQREKHSLLLAHEEGKMVDFNDKLLLPSSTRSLKRRTSLLEKGRDWVKIRSFNTPSIGRISFSLGTTSDHSSSASS